MSYKCNLLLLLIFTVSVAKGQRYRIHKEMLTMEQGLPNDITLHAMQNDEGFVWIATNYGFARFDGENIRTYATKNRENYVSKCFQDINGLIWVVLANGIDIFNPLDHTIQTFAEHFGTVPFQLEKLKQIINDSKGNIYLLLNNGDIYRYNGTFSKVAVFPYNRKSHPPIELLLLTADEAGFWISFRYYQSFLLYHLGFDGKMEAIPIPAPVKKMQLDKQGQLWLLLGEDKKSGHLYKFENKSLKPFLFSEITDIQNFIIDSKQQIWCFNPQQIAVFNPEKQLLSIIPYNENLTADAIKAAHSMVDKQGNVWLCTSAGIFIFQLQKVPFINYLDQKQPIDTRGIVVDKAGNIFVNQASTYQISKKGIDTLAPRTYGVGLLKIGNTLLIGNYADYVGVYNMNNKTYDKKYYIQNEHHRTNVNTLFQSSKTGRIWTAGSTGIGYIDTTTNKILHFNRYNAFQSFENQGVSHFYENAQGIWLATGNGIYLLDEERGIIARYAAQFATARIRFIHEDSAGIFWLGTHNEGLIRWDRAKDEVLQFTTANGLSNNVIYAVYEDEFGYLWLPSNYGLMRFNKETHEVTTYLPEDGLPHHEFNFISHARAPDGWLFFGGLGGVTSFHPKDFLDDLPYQVPLVITRFQKQLADSGKFEDFTSEALRQHKIIVQPSEKSFFISFALIDFTNLKDKQYEYKIEGLDKDWNYLEENFIRLGRLPYGNYTLHIKGRRYNQSWSKNEIHIPLLIIKPFYLKTWFLMLVSLFITAMAIISVKLRVRTLERDRQRLQLEVQRQTKKIQAQADKLQELDSLKSKLFANISHDFRTPLTLILTPLERLLQQHDIGDIIKTTLFNIRNNANNLLQLVEELIDLSRFENKQIELNEHPISLKRFICKAFSLYESLAQIQNIHYELNYRAGEDLIILLDEAKVEKILNNLLSNAFKFVSEGGSIELLVLEKESEIHIQVIDDGEGIAPEHVGYIFDRYFRAKTSSAKLQAGSGVGLSIAKEYALLMGGNLEVQSKPGEGSIFTFKFPKKPAQTTPYLPIVETALVPSISEANLPNQKINGYKKEDAATILVVEDNKEMQALFREILDSHYTVIEASDGKMALELLEKEQVHCIITDIMMPNMDGFELINILKSDENWLPIPVIAVTALAEKTHKLEALRIGIDDYLTKPFSTQELLVRTQNLIQRYKAPSNSLQSKKIQSAEQKWLLEVETKALEMLKNFSDFNQLELAAALHVSESSLRRKIKRITGISANDYIKEVKLQYAKELLEHKAHFTVAEIGYSVGFSSSSYFTKIYYERFGKMPSEYFKS